MNTLKEQNTQSFLFIPSTTSVVHDKNTTTGTFKGQH